MGRKRIYESSEEFDHNRKDLSRIRKDAFRQYRKEAAKAAEDLCYGTEVIERIKTCKTESEIARIMQDARHGNKYLDIYDIKFD